ncbi:MAG: 3-phenylpropionate/cinnamic acid dioxygenase subunit beta [Pseudomonadales bacterium]|nr:3-phenylpropionate/cinnamic acid dioxygenase subunit beta [Pseudomonadales bacterium]
MAKLQTMDTQSRMLLHFEVEQFLYQEAKILDERRFDEWLSLLTEDIHYWMPIRRTTTLAQVEDEFTKIGAMALFDDDINFLRMRVAKMASGNAWSEDPPSRTRHFVSNIQIVDIEEDGDIVVETNIHLYRTRLESVEDSWIGRRKDWLRRDGDNLKLARRHIFLEQTTILSQNLSNFF